MHRAGLRERLAEGRARWPGIELDDEVFLRHVEQHLAAAGTTKPDEHDAHSDLFLAVACLEGDAGAIARLDAELIVPIVARTASRYRDVEQADLEQSVREQLLLARDAERSAKLRSYAGRGPLEGWIRILAIRTAISMLRRRRANEDHDDIVAEEALAVMLADDVELSYARAECGPDLKASFHDALLALSSQDRTILRMHAVDDLTIDDLARLYGVHRATAARWIVRIREALFRGTKERLAARMGVGQDELQSLIGVLLSRLEISLVRVLSSDAVDVPPPSR